MTLQPTKKPKNFLNNKDILTQIHLSKNTYCSWAKPEHHRYDVIIDQPNKTLEEILSDLPNSPKVEEARVIRTNRINAEGNELVLENQLPVTECIFRVMTWDHIPVSPKKAKKTDAKKKSEDLFEFEDEEDEDSIFADLEVVETSQEVDDMVHVKVNFPPFQHFKIDENGKAYCVGKSHWIGDLESGEFSKDHGQVTNTLARMYVMLCDKYGMKFNWRGYTYLDEMKASAALQLTYVGLRFNEAKSNNPFAYFTAVMSNSFCRVLNSEKRTQNIRDDILEMNNLTPSWTRQWSDEMKRHGELPRVGRPKRA